MKYLDLTKNNIERLKDLPVILAIGATEQHGNHLSLGTDTDLAKYTIKILNERMNDSVVTLPVQWIGMSEEHQEFPGTLSISKETLRSYINDISKWLQTSKFMKLVIVNTHGGNEYALKEIIEEWNSQNNLTIIYYDIWSNEINKLTEELFGGIDEHAGDSESSLAGVIRPDLIDEGVIKNGYIKRDEETGIDGYYNYSITGAVNFKSDITIDKSKGKQLLDQMIKDLITFVTSL